MPRPIIETLHHLEGGCFLDDAGDKLAEIVKAVDASGKPGKLTLTITVRKAMSSALAIKGKIAISLPPENALVTKIKEGAGVAFFFGNPVA